MKAQLQIDGLGARGEGIAHARGSRIYVPYALPGDRIIAEIQGERGTLIEIAAPSPDRVAPFCPYYGACGGCAVQALAAGRYEDWKRGLLVAALRNARLEPNVAPLVDAHGSGRRRATFHARYDSSGNARVGFMRARAHELIDLEICPILAPQMRGALGAARGVAMALRAAKKPLDIAVTTSFSGLDIDIKGHGPMEALARQSLIQLAEAQDLARISNDRIIVIERRIPLLRMGRSEVAPPPGAFLQATEAGEEALAAKVSSALAHSRRVADLFAGIGTFSLRLAERAQVHAVDCEEAALSALAKAARTTSGLRPVDIETRDLFRRPLGIGELERFEAVLFDPPRTGAEAQARALAQSAVPLVVAVSCHSQSFARDAALLVAGGYKIESVTPFDQFRHSPHIECIGVFRHGSDRPRRPRRLLG